VSDDSTTAIPATIEKWVRPDGSACYRSIAGDLITHPHWIPVIRRLAKTSRTAMMHLIELLCRLGLGDPVDRIEDS
jgi:hypothetical protein